MCYNSEKEKAFLKWSKRIISTICLLSTIFTLDKLISSFYPLLSLSSLEIFLFPVYFSFLISNYFATIGSIRPNLHSIINIISSQDFPLMKLKLTHKIYFVYTTWMSVSILHTPPLPTITILYFKNVKREYCTVNHSLNQTFVIAISL